MTFSVTTVRRSALVLLLVVLWSAGCADGSDWNSILEESSIFDTEITGLDSGRIADRQSGDRASVTKLYDVSGSWEAASVALAEAVRADGWTIESVNCVGSGNDVIAKRRIGDSWVLLQSGAGARGAGIILSVDPDQAPPAPFTETGSCAQALVGAARP